MTLTPEQKEEVVLAYKLGLPPPAWFLEKLKEAK